MGEPVKACRDHRIDRMCDKCLYVPLTTSMSLPTTWEEWAKTTTTFSNMTTCVFYPPRPRTVWKRLLDGVL